MDTKYLINIDDGRIAPRNEYTDMQVNMKPVPDELVKMIMKKEVTVEEVLLAVGRKERENGFDLHKYIEERKKLNVRPPEPKDDAPKMELRDRTDETVSVEDVVAVKKVGKKTEKKADKAEKKHDEKPSDAGLSSVFG